jgi:energy-coupling factor transport system permease protein
LGETKGQAMLKDITLGQFFPGQSILHRLDPRGKLFLVTLYIVALFFAKGALLYAVMFLWLALSVAVCGVKVRVLLRGMKPLLIIIAFTAVLHMFTIPGDNLLPESWFIRISKQGLIHAAFIIARIFMLISSTFLLTYTTSPIQLTDALERVMSPFKKVRLPVHELAMMMTIALRFIPTLIEETDKIMNAQKARGGDFESGHIFRRIKSMIPLLVPLFVGSFRRADELATAMECRCYHGGEGRTRMKILRWQLLDLFVISGCIVTAAGVIAYSRIL